MPHRPELDPFKTENRPRRVLSPPVQDLSQIRTDIDQAEADITQAQADINQAEIEINNLQAVWSSYTPALTASSTNPTLGTGGVAQGRYKVVGEEMVVVKFYLQFGTSGVSAGSGEYRVSVPISMASSLTGTFMGSGVMFDWSVAARREIFVCERQGLTTVKMHVHDATVFHDNPWGWAADDRFGATLMYERT